MKYRVFTNDVGPNGYSCFRCIEAKSDHAALSKAADITRRFAPVKVLAVPITRLDEAFVEGSETAPSGLRLKRGAFGAWGTMIKGVA
jgi:hypothetical protein